mgnify:CR=1 FL=1
MIVTGLTKALTLLAEQIAKFVPDVEKLPDDIGQLNNRFKESGKTIEFLTGKYSALLDEIEELEKVTNSTNVGRARKAKKELKEIDDLINKEQERKKKIIRKRRKSSN